ncbi:lantibiotic dehydratase [Kitasatospora sp. NPDC094015]|uniref:lantibiotic dehydratase n=1 Tax=Kitasatospora sp. NPDC094015 TaxID=3155205 RepID=UPI00331AC792
MYRVVGPALIRAAARPRDADRSWPDLADRSAAATAGWRSWLQDALADRQLEAAIEVAAGQQLSARLRAVVEGGDIGAARLRRLTATVMRYALRGQGRATPFGLFAGVTTCPVGPLPVAPWWGRGRAVARVDAGWLAHAVGRLEELLADRIPVVANQLHVVRGDRVVLPVTQHSAGGSPVEVSVRATGPVLAALAGAEASVPVSVLANRLAEKFPRARPGQVRAMLGELVRQRLLLSALRPPMATTDPLAHLLTALEAAGVGEVPHAARIATTLGSVRAELERHNRLDDPARQRAVRASLAATTADLDGGQPLMVDLRLDGGPMVLPEPVAAEAARAAELLTRLSPHPGGNPAWLDYHARFLERYGPGAVVPVADLVNPDTGLGLPARYRDSQLAQPVARLGRRDARLLALAQKAAVEGMVEVVLDDQAVECLAPGPVPQVVQPHAEVTVHLAAADTRALAAGAFTVTLVAAPRAAGTTAGRFLYLLDSEARVGLATAIGGAPTLRADAQPVQVLVPPLFTRVENVARAEALLPVLSLGEHPPAGSRPLRLDDLGVCADVQRLWLVSLTDRRPVEPRVLNAVEFRAHTQPVARFVCEITGAFTPVFTGFDWGAAGKLPFLPRLRYGRIVLSPARWNLSAADLPSSNAPWGDWEKAARGWLTLYRVPSRVQLTQHDLKLPLDLDRSEHLVLLRDHLDQEKTAALTEAPTATANGWCGGRAHEITFQLHSTRKPLPVTRRRPARAVGHGAGHLPWASRWLYARLYGNPHRADEILAQLPAQFDRWGNELLWWFLRHIDPEPHLRLRLELPEALPFNVAGERIGAWAAELRAAGLLTRLQLDTYQPETGRYGHDSVMHQAEAVFAADSRAVVAQLAFLTPERARRQAVTAASMAAIAAGLLGIDAGTRWLLDHVPRHTDQTLPQAIRRQALTLADQPGRWPALETSAPGQALLRAWQARAVALAEYRRHLDQQGELEPADVVASLLHMHHVRAIGIDPDSERFCHRLARAVALTRTARTPEGAAR